MIESESKIYSTFAAVPTGCDLLNAPTDKLDLYGIPQRPDPVEEPQLFAFWKELVSAPFSAKVPTFTNLGGAPNPPPRTTFDPTSNWSGGIVTAPRAKRIVAVVGGWQAPAVRLPSAPALFTHSNDPKSLVWVGLDGANGDLPKTSLPQIGTAHWPGVPQFAWWDWWKNGTNSFITRIDRFDIDPGHKILAGLVVLASEDIHFFIKNQSTGEFRSFLAKRQPLGDIEPLGATADWIMERPTEPASDMLYPLPNFDPVEFRHCIALAADRPKPARSVTLANNGQMIHMREAFADPCRTVHVSRAKRRHDPDGSIGITCTFHEPT